LFVPDRRKSVAPAVPVPAAEPGEERSPLKPQLILTGIIVSASQIIVLLKDTNTDQSLAVHPGETVGRWRILVDPNYAVTLKSDTGEFALEMFAEP
jgi:hypothetical protein